MVGCTTPVRDLASKVSVRWAPKSKVFWDLPWPADARLQDGDFSTLDLSRFPNPSTSTALASYLRQIKAQTADPGAGFSTNGAIFVPLSGNLTLAFAQTATASMREDALVQLVDLTWQASSCGTRIPVDTRFFPWGTHYLPEHTLAALPVPGNPLEPRHTYGLLLSTRLQDRDGKPLAANGGWYSYMSRMDHSSLPGLKTLQTGLCASGATVPILTNLAGGTVFGTGDPTLAVRRARRVVDDLALPPPALPTRAGSLGRGCVELRGRFAAPSFQQGQKPYLLEGGGFVYDKRGMPVVQNTESVRFALVLPEVAAPATATVPLVLYAHGTGGDYRTFIRSGVAADLCQKGMAVVGFDQPLHGDRITHGDPMLLSFNFMNLTAMTHNFQQGGIDLFSLRHAMTDYKIPAARSGLPVDVVFRQPFLFMGHSQGALTGSFFLAEETASVAGAVLSGSSGALFMAFLAKVEPINIPAIFEAVLADWGTYSAYSPELALFQMAAEPSDPLNYGRYFLQRADLETGEVANGWQPKHLFISEGIHDKFTPPAQSEPFIASTGVQYVLPELKVVYVQQVRGAVFLPRPVSANVETVDGPRTAVAIQYPSGHYSLFDDADGHREYAAFLEDLAAHRMPVIRER